MDLVYMTDVMAYQTIRGSLYDRFSTWDQQSLNNSNQTRAKMVQKKNNKEPCKICQEKQRRSLLKYIRSKSHDHSEQNIKEEEEEEEDAKGASEEKDTKAKQSTT